MKLGSLGAMLFLLGWLFRLMSCSLSIAVTGLLLHWLSSSLGFGWLGLHSLKHPQGDYSLQSAAGALHL